MMRSDASQWSLSQNQRAELVREVWNEAKKLTDAGYGNIKITVGWSWGRKAKTMKCDKCGKEFIPGNRVTGEPNGVSFVLKDGKRMTLCADCIIDYDATAAWLKEQGIGND